MADACPLISIITPVLNGKELIERHISMVQSQTYPNIEHIIIDGGSTDGTVDILGKKNNEVAFWFSAPDKGIYDAMNKGIDAANGQWLLFAGVDDNFFGPETIEQVFNQHKMFQNAKLICGKVIRSDGKLIKSRFNKLLYYKNTLPHQGVFYRRDVFDKYRYGSFKKNNKHHFYTISGDYHLNLNLFSNKVNCQYIDEVIMCCGHGRSMEGDFTGYREEILIRHSFVGYPVSIFFDILTIARYLRSRYFLKRSNIWAL